MSDKTTDKPLTLQECKDKTWIMINDRLPELKDGEPINIEMIDSEPETYEGYYNDGTWWIKLPDPFVGHQDSQTFDFDINIVAWRTKK